MNITATFPDREVAYQFAQFLKRSYFDQYLACTDAYLDDEKRISQAYQMIAAGDIIRSALAEAGVDPR